MAIYKCKMCGGALDYTNGEKVCECEYCGTLQTIPSVADENAQKLFDRANNLRLKNEFDKAQELYEKVVTLAPDDSEAYWGMVLCKFGIEYVEDPATFKRVPTCHRTQFESVVSDVDYNSAISYADPRQREIYEAEAEEIDKLQRSILRIVQNEKPFDVFICYKETDENGEKTRDSVYANDIYYQLVNAGYKVFYAAITLEDKLGQEYEPYIFAAINTAKVMLVIGTKPEYFSAVWVRNEWSRFLKLVKTDHSKLLIPCYKDMDPYDLPPEFSHLQAQNMEKIGFINDLIHGIKKVVGSPSSMNRPTQYTPSSASKSSASPQVSEDKLLKRINIFLNDGDFTNASQYCEKVLDLNPECAQAYYYKFLAENSCRIGNQLYSPETINRLSVKYIRGYGYDVSSEAVYNDHIQYVIGNSLKNAIAFARGDDKKEFSHIYNGIASMVRSDVTQKAADKQKEEAMLAAEAERRKSELIAARKKQKKNKTIANLSQIIMIICIVLFFVCSSNDGEGEAMFALIVGIISLIVYLTHKPKKK